VDFLRGKGALQIFKLNMTNNWSALVFIRYSNLKIIISKKVKTNLNKGLVPAMLGRAFDNESFSLQRHGEDDVLKRERTCSRSGKARGLFNPDPLKLADMDSKLWIQTSY
jgi:hypothetical protein